jgi:hypothetical protein
MGYNIKKDIKTMGCEGLNWIELAHRVQWQVPVDVIMNIWVPFKAGNILTS